MADEDELDPADEGEASASKTELDAPAKKKKPSDLPHLALRIALGTAGLFLVVGFFLPWLQFGELTNISGMDLVISNDRVIRSATGETQRWILLLIPVLGLALTAIGYLGFRWSGIVGAGVGLLILGYGIVFVVTIFFQTTAIGLWLIIAGCFLAVGIGLFSWARARAQKEREPETRITIDKLPAE
jgi:hypothetical protein